MASNTESDLNTDMSMTNAGDSISIVEMVKEHLEKQLPSNIDVKKSTIEDLKNYLEKEKIVEKSARELIATIENCITNLKAKVSPIINSLKIEVDDLQKAIKEDGEIIETTTETRKKRLFASVAASAPIPKTIESKEQIRSNLQLHPVQICNDFYIDIPYISEIKECAEPQNLGWFCKVTKYKDFPVLAICINNEILTFIPGYILDFDNKKEFIVEDINKLNNRANLLESSFYVPLDLGRSDYNCQNFPMSLSYMSPTTRQKLIASRSYDEKRLNLSLGSIRDVKDDIDYLTPEGYRLAVNYDLTMLLCILKATRKYQDELLPMEKRKLRSSEPLDNN